MKLVIGMDKMQTNKVEKLHVIQTPHQVKETCDVCEATGNWWDVDGDIVCDHCLGFGLTRVNQITIVKQYGEKELHKRLTNRVSEIFNKKERNQLKMIDNNQKNVENLEEIQKELKAREGKLYVNFERVYVEAAKKFRKLNEQLAEASQRAKDAKVSYESERFAIEELKSKLIDLKINFG
jgi:hypothetical protein